MFKRGTYWAGTGAHQAEFKRLRSALVPVGGPAATPHGELLRAVDGIYYDLKRNGPGTVDRHRDDWQIICVWREPIVAALGTVGPWVFAVVERAFTERYLDGAARRPFPHDCFERLVDGCVLAVQRLHREAA